VIGLSPPLAYCAIFSVMSSEVVDLHICICMRVSSYQLLIVPVCCAVAAEPHSPPRRCRADPVYRPCWPVSPVYHCMSRSHVTAAVFQTRARFYDTLEWSFGDSRWEWEWVTEWYDWRSPGTSPMSRLTVFSPHRDTAVSCLTNNTLTTSSSSTDCYDDWRGRTLRSFHDASAALCLLLAASYVLWMTFSVVYYVIDSFSLLNR